jgi:hypothetical protein
MHGQLWQRGKGTRKWGQIYFLIFFLRSMQDAGASRLRSHCLCMGTIPMGMGTIPMGMGCGEIKAHSPFRRESFRTHCENSPHEDFSSLRSSSKKGTDLFLNVLTLTLQDAGASRLRSHCLRMGTIPMGRFAVKQRRILPARRESFRTHCENSPLHGVFSSLCSSI